MTDSPPSSEVNRAQLKRDLTDLTTTGARHLVSGVTEYSAWIAALCDAAGALIERVAQASHERPEVVLRQVYGYAAVVAGRFGVKAPPLAPLDQEQSVTLLPGSPAAPASNVMGRTTRKAPISATKPGAARLRQQVLTAARRIGSLTAEDAVWILIPFGRQPAGFVDRGRRRNVGGRFACAAAHHGHVPSNRARPESAQDSGERLRLACSRAQSSSTALPRDDLLHIA